MSQKVKLWGASKAHLHTTATFCPSFLSLEGAPEQAAVGHTTTEPKPIYRGAPGTWERCYALVGALKIISVAKNIFYCERYLHFPQKCKIGHPELKKKNKKTQTVLQTVAHGVAEQDVSPGCRKAPPPYSRMKQSTFSSRLHPLNVTAHSPILWLESKRIHVLLPATGSRYHQRIPRILLGPGSQDSSNLVSFPLPQKLHYFHQKSWDDKD